MNGSAATKPRRFVLVAVVAAVALALDYATKEIVLARFAPGESVAVVGDLLRFTLVFNPGAAFSIGTGMTWVFSLISIGVVVYIAVIARRLRSLAWALSLGLILGGAAGNLMDRLFRPPGPLHGHVVDWIQLPNWPVFNLADSSLVVGSALAVVLAFRGVNIDGTREGDKAGDGTGDTDEAAGTDAAGPGAGESGTAGEADGADGPAQAGTDRGAAGRDTGEGEKR
ncbi:signal peptidase II [Nocardiopsis sp. RSe5-2]|uniref:Lipoprotein signal peptidase n=1 Tax=Nocardiopsis endophytica TaxID=3018445 RepID=A0ABT4U2N6_9ACTN|nr:signal peptidase II [Nocardiopsis endophytica]MDA2810725.1 signal peptidase II [Nocardiopsis endophytica]